MLRSRRKRLTTPRNLIIVFDTCEYAPTHQHGVALQSMFVAERNFDGSKSKCLLMPAPARSSTPLLRTVEFRLWTAMDLCVESEGRCGLDRTSREGCGDRLELSAHGAAEGPIMGLLFSPESSRHEVSVSTVSDTFDNTP